MPRMKIFIRSYASLEEVMNPANDFEEFEDLALENEAFNRQSSTEPHWDHRKPVVDRRWQKQLNQQWASTPRTASFPEIAGEQAAMKRLVELANGSRTETRTILQTNVSIGNKERNLNLLVLPRRFWHNSDFRGPPSHARATEKR